MAGRRRPGVGAARRTPIAPSGGDNFLLNYADGTFTRFSEATLWPADFGASGDVLLDYGVGAPRILADGSYCCEGPITNSIVQSENLAHPVWAYLNDALGVPFQLDPSLTNKSSTVAIGGAAAPGSYITQGGTFPPGSEVSWFVKRGSQGTTAAIGLGDGAGDADVNPVPEQWGRFSAENAAGTGSGVSQGRAAPYLSPISAGSPVLLDNHDFAFPMLQEANLAFIHSYVRTTSSPATRSAETLDMGPIPPTMQNGIWEYDVWPRYRVQDNPNRSVMFEIDVQDAIVFTGGLMQVQVGGVFTNIPITTSGPAQKLTITVDFVTDKVSVLGATTGDGSYPLNSTGGWAAGNLQVGQAVVGGNYFAGRLSRTRAA